MYLSSLACWESACPFTTQLSFCSSGAWPIARKSVWLSGRSQYVDMVFAAQQLQEKYQEQNQDYYFSFIDLTKTFDTVCHNGLWKIMSKFGCPSKFVALVIHFMMGCLHESSMMASHLMPSLSQIESNKDVCWPQHCSVYCLLLCHGIHSQMMSTPSNYASILMGICST